MTRPEAPGRHRAETHPLIKPGPPAPAAAFLPSPGTMWTLPAGPRVSVFTPSHDRRWLGEAYDSLVAQTYDDWEWLVLLNDGVNDLRGLPEPMRDDPRVKIRTAEPGQPIGYYKAMAIAPAQGDILVELDHDDQLTDDALTSIVAAFEDHPDAGLIYSQCARVLEDGITEDQTRWSEEFGWFADTDTVYVGGSLRAYGYMRNPPATPHNVSLIWYAPNHVRAFTRHAYDGVGGYDPTLSVLDDQDLMARLYRHGPFHEIDRVLYLQRIHPDQTQAQPDVNPGIQTGTIDQYDRTIEQAALTWAERAGLPCLDLGGAHGEADPRYLKVDQHGVAGVDIVHSFPLALDLHADYHNVDTEFRHRVVTGYPDFDGEDSSVGVIRAFDFLEHVADKVAMLNELWRLLVPGGMLLTATPSTDGRGAFQDPTHVSYWNENSWWYVTDPNLTRFVPELHARFQVSRMVTLYPTQWHADHDISYVMANLIAIKPGSPRSGGASPFWTPADDHEQAELKRVHLDRWVSSDPGLDLPPHAPNIAGQPRHILNADELAALTAPEYLDRMFADTRRGAGWVEVDDPTKPVGYRRPRRGAEPVHHHGPACDPATGVCGP